MAGSNPLAVKSLRRMQSITWNVCSRDGVGTTRSDSHPWICSRTLSTPTSCRQIACMNIFARAPDNLEDVWYGSQSYRRRVLYTIHVKKLFNLATRPPAVRRRLASCT